MHFKITLHLNKKESFNWKKIQPSNLFYTQSSFICCLLALVSDLNVEWNDKKVLGTSFLGS